MGKKDISTKEVIQTITKDLAIYILGLNISDDIEFIDKELKRIEKREADIVALCKIDNKKSILHIEIQNDNAKNMNFRMLRYYVDIKELYPNIPVYQYVIYIGKNKLSMPQELKTDLISYSYKIIDLAKIDCEKFIKMDTPDALVLAILCDFKDKNEKDVVEYIIKRLRVLTKDDYQLSKYMLALETLSENRKLNKIIEEVEDMLRDIKIEELPSWKIATQRGIEQGIEKGRKIIVLNALKKGLDEDTIMAISGFDIDTIHQLKKEIDEIK
jgi:hypothetical protein